jgi:integrase
MSVKNTGRGRWQVVARVWTPSGKILTRQRSITGTKSEAQALEAKLKAELREGPTAGSLTRQDTLSTFGDVLSIYREKRDKTAPADVSRCEQLQRDLGGVPLGEFAARFESYIKIMRATPTKKTGKPPANATINRILEIVRAAFNLALALELVEANPISKARFPKLKETPRDVILSEIDRQRLINTVDKEAAHLSAIVRFALLVPCRKSELVNMRRDDLDLFNGSIRVRNGTTKNDQGTWKPIPPEMLDYFRGIPAGCDYLFYRQDANGGFHPLGDFKRSWKRCLKLAGVQGFRFHDTRHMSATALIDNGTPERVVMQVAGWKTDMLRNYYHRDGKRSLELVRFGRNPEGNLKTLAAANG